MTRDIERDDRSYSYRCRMCTSEWVRTFSVTTWLDEDGVEHDGFVGAGMPVPDPTRALICVSCGSNRVTVRRLHKGHTVDVQERPETESVTVAMRTAPRSGQRKLLSPRTRAFP